MSLFSKLAKRRADKVTALTLELRHESATVLVDSPEDGAEEVDDDVLRQVVGELGVSAEKIAAIQVQEGANTVLRSAAAELAKMQAAGPVERIECADCERMVVNRTGFCMYCGASVVEDTSAPAETQLVAWEQSPQRHLTDAYLQRLLRM